jgi:hypothetical protein
VGRIDLDDVADHEPSNSMRKAARCCLTVGAVNSRCRSLRKAATWEGSHLSELGDAAPLAPGREAARRVHVCLAGVVIVDLGGEEFENAAGSSGRRGEEPGGNTGRGGGGD